jgi:hypothetical protein
MLNQEGERQKKKKRKDKKSKAWSADSRYFGHMYNDLMDDVYGIVFRALSEDIATFKVVTDSCFECDL